MHTPHNLLFNLFTVAVHSRINLHHCSRSHPSHSASGVDNHHLSSLCRGSSMSCCFVIGETGPESLLCTLLELWLLPHVVLEVLTWVTSSVQCAGPCCNR